MEQKGNFAGNTLDEIRKIEEVNHLAINLQVHGTQEWSQHQEGGAKKPGLVTDGWVLGSARLDTNS